MSKKPVDQYGDKETEQRMKAALKGARLVGHKPMKPVKKTKKTKTKSAGAGS